MPLRIFAIGVTSPLYLRVYCCMSCVLFDRAHTRTDVASKSAAPFDELKKKSKKRRWLQQTCNCFARLVICYFYFADLPRDQILRCRPPRHIPQSCTATNAAERNSKVSKYRDSFRIVTDYKFIEILIHIRRPRKFVSQ